MYRCSNSSPRYSVRTTMLPLYTIQKFLRFPFYKISITLLLFLLCLGKGCPNPIAKVTKILDKSLSLNDFLYFLGGIYAYSDFHPITLLLGSKPQTVSPFMRFLPEPLHKWNIVHAYFKMPFPAFIFFERESCAFCVEFTVKFR